MGVAAKTRKEVLARFQCLQQVKVMNRSSRPMRLVPIARKNNGRPAISLHDTCRRNADHAPVPALTIQYDAVGVAQLRSGRHPFFDFLDDLRFLLLTFAVQNSKALRDFPSSLRILLTEKVNNGLSDVHAPGCIEPGSHPKRNVAGGDGTGTVQRGNL